MAFEIEITLDARAELKAIRVFERKQIVDEIEVQLTHEPAKETRNRKCLKDVSPGFEHVAPAWELRVEDYRVFYDIDSENQRVYVRAVREKRADQTTEEIIQ
jgi:mRNA-degrading endonuclease RelE of RelBE toxin-antitoxin system